MLGYQPVWDDDPALRVLSYFLHVHGHLDVAGPVTDRSIEEKECAQALTELRGARCQDVRDTRGFLVRRQLTDEDVAMWET